MQLVSSGYSKMQIVREHSSHRMSNDIQNYQKILITNCIVQILLVKIIDFFQRLSGSTKTFFIRMSNEPKLFSIFICIWFFTSTCKCRCVCKTSNGYCNYLEIYHNWMPVFYGANSKTASFELKKQ